MANYKGKKVKLNKPFRTPGKSKKSAVYVRNPKTGNVIVVRFGDPKLSIKKINQHVNVVLWHVTNVALHVIEPLRDIGAVELGDEKI